MMKDEDTESASTSAPSSDRSVQHGRSCTGCLYHSSYRQKRGRNPLCVGFSRSEKQAYKMVANQHPEFDRLNSQLNDGKRLLQFKYACLGYSVYNQSSPTSSQGGRIELPACIGVEMQLLDPEKAAQVHPVPEEELPVQTTVSDETEEPIPPAIPQPTQRPLGGPIKPIKGDEFATRFLRTAGLIAAAVGNNLSRVAGSLKTGLDDIIYPDRRRPK